MECRAPRDLHASGPLCIPTRQSLLTGWWLRRTYHLAGKATKPVSVRPLQRAGYVTAMGPSEDGL